MGDEDGEGRWHDEYCGSERRQNHIQLDHRIDAGRGFDTM